MRYWTIVPKKTYEALRQNKTLRVTSAYADEDLSACYPFMVKHMRKRLPDPGEDFEFPWWCWVKPKPDLRSGGHLPRGQIGYRLELEMDERLVLCSCFMNWHHVLNDYALFETDEEYDAWDEWEKTASPEKIQAAKNKQWEKIFDTDTANVIQGTFWELRFQDVIKATKFKAR